MAVIWSKSVNSVLYEVRTAGRTSRLYRNGVLHTAYNPKRLFTGSIWDLLFLPTLFYPKSSFKKVLILGVGGGTIVHLLNRYTEPKSIIGVDIDAVHLSIAKRFFNLKYTNLKLYQMDAVKWVSDHKNLRFDLIVEDMFIEKQRSPGRLMNQHPYWLNRLHGLLTPGGMLVINNGDNKEAKFSKQFAKNYSSAFQLAVPQLDNKVLAFLKKKSSSQLFYDHLKTNHELQHLYAKGLLKYQLREHKIKT